MSEKKRKQIPEERLIIQSVSSKIVLTDDPFSVVKTNINVMLSS